MAMDEAPLLAAEVVVGDDDDRFIKLVIPLSSLWNTVSGTLVETFLVF